MDFLTVSLIAVGLAMDAFAVSVAHGTGIRVTKLSIGVKLAFTFGFFQGLMPVIGYFAGLSFRDLISSFDHWVAFGLLVLIGGKMIYESLTSKAHAKNGSVLTVWSLLVLAVATSIDALAVGLSFSLLSVSIFLPVVFIGVVTFVLSLSGYVFGSKIGQFFGSKIETLGGLILLAIGIRVLIEHMA